MAEKIEVNALGLLYGSPQIEIEGCEDKVDRVGGRG